MYIEFYFMLQDSSLVMQKVYFNQIKDKQLMIKLNMS